MSKVVDFVSLKILPPPPHPSADHDPLWEHSQSKWHLICALTGIFSLFNYISMAVTHRQPALAAFLRWMTVQGLMFIRQSKNYLTFLSCSLIPCFQSHNFSHSLPTGACRVSHHMNLSESEQDTESESYTYSLQGKSGTSYRILQPLASVQLKNLSWQSGVLVKSLSTLRGEKKQLLSNYFSSLQIMMFCDSNLQLPKHYYS